MLYSGILILHNALRWFVLSSILATLVSAYAGWLSGRPYTAGAQTLRVVTTSIAHTQLLVGMYLYTISPLIKYYWQAKPAFGTAPAFPFFGLIHIGFMLTAIVVMTIGSSKAKRQAVARQQFKTTAVYFTAGLVLILIAVPWPFSPWVARPWVRTF